MSGFIGDTLDTTPPNETDKNVLHLIFGEKTCADDPLTKFFWFLGFAILATILFFLLCFPPVTRFVNGYIKNETFNLGLRVVVFFIVILILDFVFLNWRRSNPICNQDPKKTE